MWSDTNKHKLNIILKEIQINTQGDAPPCTSALLRWQWPTPQCGHVWCTRSPHTLLQNGRAAFDVSVNSPKLNIQLSCNLVVPFLLYPRGLKTSVPMNLYYTFTIHISQSLNFKVKKKKKKPNNSHLLGQSWSQIRMKKWPLHPLQDDVIGWVETRGPEDIRTSTSFKVGI